MHDEVIISHRGARYEIGRGAGFYGIWPAGGAQPSPLEWWPENAAGWQSAWSRFTDIEVRRTIVPVGQPAGPASPASPHTGTASPASPHTDTLSPAGQHTGTASPASPHTGTASPASPHTDAASQQPVAAGPAGRRPRQVARYRPGSLIAAALLAVGVALGIAGLFPGYFGGVSLARQPAEVVPHAIYLAAWVAGAVLLVLGGARQRTGALLAAGTSIVTFGFFLADAGTALTAGAHLFGAGLVLSLVGWLACAAGSATGLRLSPTGAPGRPRNLETALTLTLAAVAGARHRDSVRPVLG